MLGSDGQQVPAQSGLVFIDHENIPPPRQVGARSLRFSTTSFQAEGDALTRRSCGTLARADGPAHPDPWPVALAHPEKPNSSADCKSQNLPHLLPREEPADRDHKTLGNSCSDPTSASKGRAAQRPRCKRGSGLLAPTINLANVGVGQQLACGTTMRSGGLGIPHSATCNLGTLRSKQTLRSTKDA